MSFNRLAQKFVSAAAAHSLWQFAAWSENRRLTKTANVYYQELNITADQAKHLATLTVIDGTINPSIFGDANFFAPLERFKAGTDEHEEKFQSCLKSALSHSKFTSTKAEAEKEKQKEKITF